MFGLENELRELDINEESFEAIKALGQKIAEDHKFSTAFKIAGLDLIAAGMRCKIELLQIQIKEHDKDE